MIGLLQRAKWGRVLIDGQVVAAIGPGLVVLVGVERGDQPPAADRLAERLLAYRVFPDADGRMNRSLTDVEGELLLIPQFTLAADTRHGNRPGFEPAAPPAEGRALFERLVAAARSRWPKVQTGQFGADMEVELLNSGPVTFSLRIPPAG
ncbi:MAG: D-tyrosyl-tRNA(Tyr) deacylase [Gammaproteobacteria bacterium]|nr:D-tyrosyl-tRNA(Tyr) deacylase [Gammaproteobacteria bacterium]